MTVAFGEELKKLGYRGYFELDSLRDLDTDQLYLGEVNPRLTGASAMTNLAAFAHADAPLFLFHLLASGVCSTCVRYVLQTCDTTEEAIAALCRLRCHTWIL